MTFPVVGSNIPTTYQISNSLRFNDNDSPRLTKTFSVEGNVRTNTFSCWVKRCNLTQSFIVAARHTPTGSDSHLKFDSSHRLAVKLRYQDSADLLVTNRVFRDVGAWYHIVFMVDSTQATVSDRVKLYVNGVEETSFATDNRVNLGQNNTEAFGDDVEHAVAGRAESATSEYSDLYIAEAHFINGSNLDATSFGEFDEDSGVWKPKIYEGTYGTNGFYLKFNNTGNMGEDSSGNDNTFTPTNLSGTTDVTTDTPTNNFATLNALHRYTDRFSEGNLKLNGVEKTGTPVELQTSTLGATSGKWYWEVKFEWTGSLTSTSARMGIGTELSVPPNPNSSTDEGSAVQIQASKGGTLSFRNLNSSPTTNTTGFNTLDPDDIFMFALDIDNKKLFIGKNGSWYNSADPVAGTNAQAYSQTFSNGDITFPVISFYSGDTASNTYNHTLLPNFGNPAFSISSGNSDGNGYGNFEYSVPSGYLALCTQNLATELSPTIDDGSQYFNTITYTANRTARSLTGVGFQPDWVWIKDRGGAQNNALFDSNRGVNKQLRSDTTDAEITGFSNLLTSFDSDGFSLGNDSNVGDVNYDLQSHVAWNWLANGGTTSSNTDGSITSTVQANTTAGFSIVTYTGTQANATVGHGLGVAPKFIITKCRSSTNGWPVYHYSLSATDFVRLNQTSATATNSIVWNNTEPTSNVFTVGANDENNKSGADQLAYCFAEIEGYSKFGSYTANGSSDGTFVYTGFRPAFLITKRTNSAEAWDIRDTTRSPINVADLYLRANTSGAEVTYTFGDFLSNGFKFRNTGGSFNGSSGDSYIYMAFAENPFVTSGAVPVTAR